MTVSGVHRGEQRRRYDERKVRCAREQGYKVLRIPTSGVSYRGRYLTHDHRADRRVLRELLDEAGIDVD